MDPPESERRVIDFERDRRFFRGAAGIASILHYLRMQRLVTEDFVSKRTVELGCGSGTGLWVLRCLGAEITGVDPQKYPDNPMYQKNPLIGGIPYLEVTSLEFLRDQPDASYDAILAFNVESDVWTEEVADQAARVLRPHGLVVITWQHVNLSQFGWPEGWPKWPFKREIRGLYRKVGQRADPRALALGRIEINPAVSSDEVGIPDAFVMVGRKVQ